ncbi:MAG: hypothetical protein J0I69_04845 [Altererythrobacter sp.]|nr:hypothetical protein [Altererythrobacter sp.]
MLIQWFRRRHWMRSGGFAEAVEAAYGEMTAFYGDKALETARRKLARRHQRVSRRLVWRAVVARLEAEAAQAPAISPDLPGGAPAPQGPRPLAALPAAAAQTPDDVLPPVFQ